MPVRSYLAALASCAFLWMSGCGSGVVPTDAISPLSVSFDKTALGSTSAGQSITVRNTGVAALHVTSMELVGAMGGSFHLLNSCPAALSPGQACNVQVVFSPTSAGLATASLTIVDDAHPMGETVALSGTGFIPPTDSIGPKVISFAKTLVGRTSPALAVTVNSTGVTPLTVGPVTLGGVNAGDFQITNECVSPVAPGSSCTILVTFAPSTTVPDSALLNIVDDAHDSPQAVALSGTGMVAVVASAAVFNFGERLTGSESVAVLELTNPGQTPIALHSVSLTGSGAAAFRLTDNCGIGLVAGGSCGMTLTFSAPAGNSFEAAVDIESDAANSSFLVPVRGQSAKSATADIGVYAATPAGITAAVEAARHGKTVILADPTMHVGGMMSNGLGASDLYPGQVPTGILAEFFGAIRSQYTADQIVRNGTLFEPHVAEQAFLGMLEQYPGISLVLGTGLGEAAGAAKKAGNRITSFLLRDGREVGAQEFIDASYTGDLMAMAGVDYRVGREASSEYGESNVGVGQVEQLVNRPVPAFVVPNDPSSGLLPHLTPEGSAGAPGTADGTVMAYNYRLCLSSDPANQVPITPPDGYDPAEFELAARAYLYANPTYDWPYFISLNVLPNHKYDLNSSFALSTDEVGANYGYPNGSESERAAIEAEEKRYMRGIIYFLKTDPRFGEDIRSREQALGLCKDEFTDNGNWPHQIYVREARRMVGAKVLTKTQIMAQTAIPDAVALAGYPSDDHAHHLTVLGKWAQREYTYGGVPPEYAIPYSVLTPKEDEASNLLVPVEVSATHWAYDTLRVESTYMQMGQAAGAAAALAVDENVAVQGVDIGALQGVLTKEGVILTPRVAAQ